MIKTELIVMARQVASQHGLDPDLVCGMIQRESSWNPWTIRYEPGFMSHYIAPLYTLGKFSATEAYGRSFSWGLMQVMGDVARENGFTGSFLAQLCDPQIGIEVGCVVFAKHLAKTSGDAAAALLAWNGGCNPKYPAEVLAFAEQFRSQFGQVKI
jgi:soluble lytic murein transglycosylase-like protein